jgi:hypothetical protein
MRTTEPQEQPAPTTTPRVLASILEATGRIVRRRRDPFVGCLSNREIDEL